MQYRMILAATLALGTSVYAVPAQPQVTKLARAVDIKRQDGGSSVLDAPKTIAAGETFDGGNAVFDRGVKCTGQAEGGSSDAVFILESGASLSNVRIGANQIEGVHCMGGCTLTNVWWDAVCEDAFSIKEQSDGQTTTINGGGATGADDKVIQHNGGGTVVIKDFEVSDFGKLYRSCGNCKSMPARHVEVIGGKATNGKMLVGINPNMGDTAKISGVQLNGVDEECAAFKGVTSGEPTKVGSCSDTSGGGSGGGSSGGDESAAPSKTASSGGSTKTAGSGGSTKTAGSGSSTKTKSPAASNTAGSGSGSGSTKTAKASKTSSPKASSTPESGSDEQDEDEDEEAEKKDKKSSKDEDDE